MNGKEPQAVGNVDATEARPNILLIISDDQGAWALGSAGNDEIVTRNLDRLAQDGVRFSNFYAVSPVCSPARASILTGQIPSYHGVHDWILPRPTDAEFPCFLDEYETIPGVLRAHGYRCGHFGKWHLGDATTPHCGYDRWFALEGSHGSYWSPQFQSNYTVSTTSNYVSDMICDEAGAFIENSCNMPFFACVNFTAPHHPWLGQHPVDLTGLYETCSFASCPQVSANPDIHWRQAEAVRKAMHAPRESLIGYFAAVTGMDRAIGRVIDRLEASGNLNNTVVIFVSDNGYNCGHRGIWGKGNATLPVNVYETSVKVPGIVRYPKLFPSDHVSDVLASGYDIFPTVLDVAGLPREMYSGPGRSLRAAVRSELAGVEDSRRVVVFDEYGMTQMLRKGRYKIVNHADANRTSIFDLWRDPDESDDLFGLAGFEGVGSELMGSLQDWFLRFSRPDMRGSSLPIIGTGQQWRLGAGRDLSEVFPQWD